MNETTFENAKQGDWAWNIDSRTWGKIVKISNNLFTPIHFIDENGYEAWVDFNGCPFRRTSKRVLFWDEIPIVAPPRPKKMVKKVVEGWINYYNLGKLSPFYGVREEADKWKGPDRLGEAIHIHHEYEVEE